jgi:choline dehydrogenase
LFPEGLGVLTDAFGFAIFEKFRAEYNSTLTPSTRSALEQLHSDWPVYKYLPVNSDMLMFRAIESKLPTNTTLSPNYGSLAGSLSAPFSSGSVTTHSPSNLNVPVVDIGPLTDKRDIELLTKVFNRCRQAWTHPATKRALIGNEYWPEYDIVPGNDGVVIRNHVVQNVVPIWEARAACKMGAVNDSLAVVDSRARVVGVQGVRVVYASALPFGMPGQPAAARRRCLNWRRGSRIR